MINTIMNKTIAMAEAYPISNSLNAVSYKNQTSTLVDSIGPPSVNTEMISNTLNVEMVPVINRKSVVGDTNGTVICLNLSQKLAPSISADSYSSFDID